MAEIDVHEEKVLTEKYPCFVKVSDEENGENCIELPTEGCGTILLSTIQAQFPNAIGLKYKSPTGAWRGIRLSDNVLDPPFEGWGDTTYHITLPKTGVLSIYLYLFAHSRVIYYMLYITLFCYMS